MDNDKLIDIASEKFAEHWEEFKELNPAFCEILGKEDSLDSIETIALGFYIQGLLEEK